MDKNAWHGFRGEDWQRDIDVRAFIRQNYRPYDGGAEFLAPPSERTAALWQNCRELLREEAARGGVYAVDTATVTAINAFPPGFIDRDREVIVGLQTDLPLKRAINPYGGIRMTEQACAAYGYQIDERIRDTFTRYRRTHNEGVFAAYTPEMLRARKSGVITGLPDAYGRGRIIGDYRRVPLYGVDRLIACKEADRQAATAPMTEENIRRREELHDQITALTELKELGRSYGFDLGRPAAAAAEAVQWLYLAYLAVIKEQNGAAMSLGRVSTFLDIYLERDLAAGVLNESSAQELIDQFVIKLRLARELRTPDYNELFAGDPLWITEVIGGAGLDGRHLVTKTSFRFLRTLENLGPAPEPNLTVLWTKHLPVTFKSYCATISLTTSSIQYENDDIMRPEYGDDYGIACCVSAMRLGQQMQFFGARCNLAKALLLALNGGRDELNGQQVAPPSEPVQGEYLAYPEVREKFDRLLDWLCALYVDTMNIIHYMHDKYAYEKLQMALHDTAVDRLMAFGIAGLSVAADALSAIKYARVKPLRNAAGIIVDFQTEGEFPQYGNDDDRVDSLAVELVEAFTAKLHRHPAYRGAKPTLSVLTITSNVVYGKKTGATPDGRKAGEPFAPGANPMHGRDRAGALASLNSVAKLPYAACQDGISCTFSVVPPALGKTEPDRQRNLTGLLDGYFFQPAHHLNVNVLDRETLIAAMRAPENYPQLTIRVSGYAVNFTRLSRAQQEEILARTFHASM